jgi:hypothetical protein
MRRRYALRFAIVGFAIGVSLRVYAFYLDSHGRIGNAALFLIPCPPSFGAFALDGAGIVEGLIGWLLICVMNAILYGLVGFGVGDKVERKRRKY